jgi:hypothetical protein
MPVSAQDDMKVAAPQPADTIKVGLQTKGKTKSLERRCLIAKQR